MSHQETPGTVYSEMREARTGDGKENGDKTVEIIDIDMENGGQVTMTEQDSVLNTAAEMEVDSGQAIEVDHASDSNERAPPIVAGWQARYEMLGREMEQVRGQNTRQSKRRQWQGQLLSQVLETQMLLGTSIDLMRDCLEKFKVDGHAVDHAV